MRKLLLICLLAMIFFAFYSCKKKSSPQPVTDASLLIGTWYYQLDTVKEAITGGGVKTGVDSYYHGEYYIEYNTNGTGYDSINGNGYFSYTVSGNVITLNYRAITIVENEPGGMTFTISHPAYTQTAIIRSITPSALSILYSNYVSNNSIQVVYYATYLTK